MVKAALATALEYDGKTLADFERDILKQAKEEDKKKDSKPRLGMLAPFMLVGSAAKGTANAMGNSAITAGELAGKLDESMDAADNPLNLMNARKQMLQRAIEDLQARHPHLV